MLIAATCSAPAAGASCGTFDFKGLWHTVCNANDNEVYEGQKTIDGGTPASTGLYVLKSYDNGRHVPFLQSNIKNGLIEVNVGPHYYAMGPYTTRYTNAIGWFYLPTFQADTLLLKGRIACMAFSVIGDPVGVTPDYPNGGGRSIDLEWRTPARAGSQCSGPAYLSTRVASTMVILKTKLQTISPRLHMSM